MSVAAALSGGAHIPVNEPYWRDIKLPGGIKAEQWNGFHDFVLIEELHKPDFGAVNIRLLPQRHKHCLIVLHIAGHGARRGARHRYPCMWYSNK